ncbi:hypothetical protein HPS36_15730 (plasmid) [Halorubrum salinarum]|uniref:Uncharacterized protein n=1 Tax=Halorubrum salinarum TaxID=2739057 RepID=A0A7D3Y2L2_9EURY|nr:hypothetical protein [Halorubrum salinarum]QKG94332.1 hypothetical protein HPS36_15730 [Halorubrum salinarum]
MAIDTETGRVVASPTSHPATGQYRCLFCDAPLTATSDYQTPGTFVHATTETCQNFGNVSRYHRLGQELVSKQLCNWLPVAPRTIAIDLEKRVGGDTEYIIADVRITDPIQLVVEIVYQASTNRLRDRLHQAFANDYGAMVVVLTNADTSAARIERDLATVGTISVGRVDPFDKRVTIGSVMAPDQIELAPPAWESVPMYLA